MRKGPPHGTILRMPRPRSVIVYCTLPSESAARKIAKSLLGKHLIACANILGSGPSLYRWKGKITETDEIVVLMKTTEAKYIRVEKAILSLHPYECPCIVGISIDHGNAEYLQWIEKQ